MIYRARIEEIIVPGRRLGRHIHADSRSAAFPASLASTIRSVRHASAGLPLDQGNTGSCTGNALAGALNTAPHWSRGAPTLTEKDALAVYSDEEVLEGIGPYPPNDQGGSGTVVCQAGKNRGWLIGYQHASTIDDALRALVPRPVITGVNWFNSFDNVDDSGIVSIAPRAYVRGGHEFVLDEIDTVNELVWGWNSWGTGFAKGGRFGMRFSTWETLLGQGGDVTVPRTAKGWKASPIA